MLEPWFPSPSLAVNKALEQFGGWFRMFGQSRLELDKKNILYSDKEMGFWVEWAKVRGFEQLKEDVELGCREFRRLNGNKIPLAELRERMARALLQSGWKPNKAKIIKEMRAIKKSKREDLLCLRKSFVNRPGKKGKRKSSK